MLFALTNGLRSGYSGQLARGQDLVKMCFLSDYGSKEFKYRSNYTQKSPELLSF